MAARPDCGKLFAARYLREKSVICNPWSNIAEKMNGVQFGGCMSVANDLEGLQLAAFNWGSCCRGVQIGVINQCEKMEGLQMGVVNYADAASGCQIGVFNVIATSSIPFLPLVNMNF